MTYDEYVIKVRRDISRLRAAREWIKAHRFPIIAGFVAVVAAVFALMYFSGTFTRSLTAEDRVYGESGGVDVRAFLSEVDLSYEKNGEVTYEPPYAAGSYTVTAETKNPLGKVRSESASFTIARRPAEITLSPFTVEYGEKPDTDKAVTVIGLAERDRLVYAQIVYDEMQIYGTAEISDVRIENEDGEDVTSNYDLTLGVASFHVVPRPITVQIASAEKKYDGEELFCHEYSISYGSLAEGDAIDVSFSSSVTNPGSTQNLAEASFSHGGEDRSHMYSVTYKYGTLTVTPLVIKAVTGSAEKMYDGQPLTCEEYELDTSELLEGHTAEVTSFAERTNAGTAQNIISFGIYDAEGNNCTQYYKFEYEAGELTVLPRPITVRSESGGGEYGKDIYIPEAQLLSGTVAEGQKLSFTDFKTYMFAGTFNNTFEAVVSNSKGHDATRNYEIKYEYGTVEITKRPVKIRVRIDGMPGRDSVFYAVADVIEGSLAFNDRLVYVSQIPLSVSNDNIESQFLKSFEIRRERTESELNKDVTYCYDTEFVFEYDTDRLDATREQAPHVPGTTEDPGVTDVPGTSTDPDDPEDPGQSGAEERFGPSGIGSDGPEGGSENSEGPGATLPASTPAPGNEQLGVVSTKRSGAVYLRLRSYGDYTGSGWAEPAVYEDASASGVHPLDRTYHNLESNGYGAINELLIVSYYPDNGLFPVPYYTDSKSFIPTGRYEYTDIGMPSQGSATLGFNHMPQPDLHTVLGLLTADGARLQYDEDYYDFVCKHYLSLPSDTERGIKEIIEAAGLDPDSPTIISDVAEYVRSAAVYNGNHGKYPEGADRVLYFLNESKEGVCGHFASAAVVIYRALGIPARYTAGYYVCSTGDMVGTPFYEKDAHAWAEVYVREIGWIPVEVTSSNVAEGGAGSQLQPPDQSSMMFYNLILFSMQGAEKEYDGEYLYSEGPEILQGSNLREGHTVTARSYGIKNAGEIIAEAAVFRITDRDGNDVTDQYVVNEYKTKRLQISPIEYSLPDVSLYVGQTIRPPDSYTLTDERISALIGTDVMTFPLGQAGSCVEETDGMIRGVYAADRDLTKDYDFGSVAEGTVLKDIEGEIVIKINVSVKPFYNVRVHEGEEPPTGGSYVIRRVEGENGRIYNYLAVVSANAEKTFDGTYLTYDGFVIADGALEPGHTLVFKSASSQLYVGTCPNRYAKLYIVDGSGTDVTSGYLIDFYAGSLTVKPGTYSASDMTADVTVDEVADLRGIVWDSAVSDIPVTYTIAKSNPGVRVEGFDMIGIEPGRAEVTAVLQGLDLNGDGNNEYEQTVRTLRVRILPKKETGGSYLYLLFALSLAAAAAAVTYVMISVTKEKNAK